MNDGDVVNRLFAIDLSMAQEEHIVEDHGVMGEETLVDAEGDGMARHQHDASVFQPDVWVALDVR